MNTDPDSVPSVLWLPWLLMLNLLKQSTSLQLLVPFLLVPLTTAFTQIILYILQYTIGVKALVTTVLIALPPSSMPGYFQG